MEEEIYKKIKKETMTSLEKERGLLQMKDFIHKNPIRYQKIKSPFFTFFFERQKLFVSASTFMLLFIITSGTIFAANSSLPGDVLYPIKININEKLESFSAFNTKKQVEIKIDKTLLRLQEAEKLSSENKLSNQKKSEIIKNFVSQTEEVSKEVKKIEDSGDKKTATEIGNDFSRSLGKHSAIISELSTTTDKTLEVTESKQKAKLKQKELPKIEDSIEI